jgi:hypothetical protein
MKLATIIQTERGKELIKTANERIEITLTVDKKPRYFIALYANDTFVIEHIDTNKELYRYEPK